MSPTTNTMPPGTKAALLRQVLDLRHSYEKASVAAHFNITLDELQAIVRAHGNGDPAITRRHIDKLEQDAVAQTEPHTTPDADVPTEAPTEAGDADPMGQLTRVKLTRLHADPNNPRDNLSDIEDLAASIQELGLLQPITVRTDGPRLVVLMGHRRLAACRLLRWDTAPVVIKPTMRSGDVIAAMLVENNQRVDLDPIEEALGLKRLKIERDITDSKVATIVGRSGKYVSDRIALLSLTVEQQAEVRAGNMKLTEAAHHGRQNGGNTMRKGVGRGWHLGPEHPLAQQVKRRCLDLGHLRGRTVGGMGCGSCWEHVIRTSERVDLTDNSMRTGTCNTCGSLTAAAGA